MKRDRTAIRIHYNSTHDWYIVKFFNGKTRNYASFETLIGALTDFYKKDKK